MPIGIATLHYGFNEGAILQAYALTRLIEAHTGIPAKVVDQRYPDKVKVYGQPDNERKVLLEEVINNWLPTMDQHFETNDTDRVFQYINQACRALVVGSDVVWNLRYRRRLRRFLGRGILPTQPYAFYPAFPNLYWPGKSVTIPKISYAASVGTFEWKDASKDHRRQMLNILSDFSVLSVRDERTLHFVEWLDPKLAERTTIVPDPTLAMDIRNLERVNSLRLKLESYGVDFRQPICGVVCDHHIAVGEVVRRLRNAGYQIAGITTKNEFSDVILYDKPIHPLDWAIIFKLMDVCIVDRMHAAIFCLHNQTPFVALDSYETRCDNDSKTRSLLRNFGVEDCCLSKRRITADQLEGLFTQVCRDGMPWELVANRMSQYAKEAGTFFAHSFDAVGIPR